MILTFQNYGRRFANAQMINIWSAILLDNNNFDSIIAGIQIHVDHFRVFPVSPATSVDEVVRGTHDDVVDL
jgi:hypothetical protein